MICTLLAFEFLISLHLNVHIFFLQTIRIDYHIQVCQTLSRRSSFKTQKGANEMILLSVHISLCVSPKFLISSPSCVCVRVYPL
jgi:hypothetical protein